MTTVGYLASNQVVGGSSPSGRAKFINDLRHFRKFELSNKNKNIKVVIGGWEIAVERIGNSDWLTYRPNPLVGFDRTVKIGFQNSLFAKESQ